MYLIRRVFRFPADRCWRPETGIFLAIWLALMVGGRSRLFRDPGTFWHTKVGQQLLESRQFIDHDPFSFTAEQLFPGGSWVPQQWLGECLMALIHRVQGWDSLLLATVTLLAALYTWVAHRLIRAGLHWALAASLTALAVAAGASHFHARPHLTTLVFFALTCAFLNDFEMGRTRLAHLFWLVPGYALWTNLHGGMLGGLGSLAIVFVGWTAAKLFHANTPIERWSQAGVLGLLLIACGLTAFVNPYGWRLPATWVKIMGMPHLSEIIQEHARLDPTQPEGVVVALLGVLYLAILAGVDLRDWRVTWLLPLLWLYLACGRVRHAPLFAIAAVLAAGDVFPHTRWAAALVRRGSDLFIAPSSKPSGRRHTSWPFLVPAAVVLVAFVLQSLGVAAPVFGRGWARLDPAIWPVELAQPLAKYPDGTHLFNELNLGGFVIYYAPQLRVFVDDRCELYGDDFLREYDHVARAEPELVENWAARFGFRLALTQSGSPLDQYFRDPESGWRLVATSEAANLFHRSDQCVRRSPLPPQSRDTARPDKL